MTETAGEDPQDAADGATQPSAPKTPLADHPADGASPPSAARGDEASARSQVSRSRDQLTPAEREFIRRYAEDFPPHHESRWG